MLAIDDFQRFIDIYSNHELVKEAQKYIEDLQAKLALKCCKNADLYRKLKKFEAALIYYRIVIREYPRTSWADKARYGIGLVYLKQNNYEKAEEQFQYLVNNDSISEDLKKKASKKLDYIERH